MIFSFDSFPFEVLIFSCKSKVRVMTIIKTMKQWKMLTIFVYTKELMKDVVGTLEEKVGNAIAFNIQVSSKLFPYLNNNFKLKKKSA